MTVNLHGVRTVLLPGTGSDEDYLRRAFAGPLRQVGATLIAVAPEPRRLVAGYLDALEEAAASGPIAVGGVSLGAAVAAAWALSCATSRAGSGPEPVIAVLAALPPWIGASDDAPAAQSARYTAEALRRDGLTATVAAMRASSPAWLADELSRSWRRQGPDLADALEQAAGYAAPRPADFGRLAAPMGVVAVSDDPTHPLAVARRWVAAAPRAALRTVTLADFGPHPAALGTACLEALQHADRSG